jgi:hypothetical protein
LPNWFRPSNLTGSSMASSPAGIDEGARECLEFFKVEMVRKVSQKSHFGASQSLKP